MSHHFGQRLREVELLLCSKLDPVEDQFRCVYCREPVRPGAPGYPRYRFEDGEAMFHMQHAACDRGAMESMIALRARQDQER
jgi:hypothetical protein